MVLRATTKIDAPIPSLRSPEKIVHMKTTQRSISSMGSFDYFILLFLVVYFCWTGLDAISALVTGVLDAEPYWGEKTFLYIDLGLFLTSGICIFLILSKLKHTRLFLIFLISLLTLLIVMGVARRFIYHGEAAGYVLDTSPFIAFVCAFYAWVTYSKMGHKKQ